MRGPVVRAHDRWSNHMDVNLPDVHAEVAAAFARYETALVTNDVATLQELFWRSELTIRYGIAENLYGSTEISSFRTARARWACASHFAHGDHDVWSRLRHRLYVVPARYSAGQDRPSDADLGEISRGLARRRGARQHDRSAEVILSALK